MNMAVTPDVQSFVYRDSMGQDRWDAFTVSTNLTVVGTLTAKGRARTVGRCCEFQVSLVADTSIASTAGTTYLTLPIEAVGLAGHAAMTNDTTGVAVGLAVIQVSTSRCFLPTQAASANTFKVYGVYEIGR